MATKCNSRGQDSLRQLKRCRKTIAGLPQSQQPAVLHEFEEAETRMSAIARANVAAQMALAERQASQEVQQPLGLPNAPLADLLRSLKRCRRELGEQLQRIENSSR